MTPYYSDDWLTVYHGDARTVLSEIPAESVHCVVTSPPYWGLRDYGTASWDGGDPDCDHKVGRFERGGLSAKQASNNGSAGDEARHECPKCGATRIDNQLGLEPTPEQYVENMVAVFREVRRVLRSDGTVWLNLGDSYATGTATPSKPSMDNDVGYWNNADKIGRSRIDGRSSGLKPKDLVGIPWRVAFALQADGWYLRSDVIWSKPNPMPESVTDRPTKSHEYLFLLSKSARYYYDADAVREPHTESTLNRIEYGLKHRHPADVGVGIPPVDTDRMGERFANPSGRNMRSVWSIATAPYPGAHFATFPPKLVEPCIKAGSPANGVVLDCFAGSGTTGMVAQSLSRRAVLIDLSMDYLGQLMERNREIPLGLGS